MFDLQTLSEQHRAILASTDQLLSLLRDAGPDQVAAVADCRVELSRRLHQNLLSEEEIVIAPLRRGNLTRHIACYASVATATTDLRQQYSVHVAEWNLRAIQQNWPGYAVSVRALVGALRTVIQRKERELWPAAERTMAGAGAGVGALPA